MYLSLNKLTSKYGQIVVLILYMHSLKLQESQSSFYHFIFSRFFFGSNATNFFIHSLNRFVLKRNTHMLLVFFIRVPYMQIYPLNACKLD